MRNPQHLEIQPALDSLEAAARKFDDTQVTVPASELLNAVRNLGAGADARVNPAKVLRSVLDLINEAVPVEVDAHALAFVESGRDPSIAHGVEQEHVFLNESVFEGSTYIGPASSLA